jgi:hypothetical protein
LSGKCEFNPNPALDGVEYAVFGVQGKARRRGMVRPRRAEQYLPQEGVTPQGMRAPWNAVAASPALPDPRYGIPGATLLGAPFQGVATQSCAAKIVQPVPLGTHPKGEGQAVQKLL